jgi:glycosyltransferase involved in cell wall biosynthesis
MRRLTESVREAGQPVVIWLVDAVGSRPEGAGRENRQRPGAIPVRRLPAPVPGQTMRSRIMRGRAVGAAEQAWRHALRADHPAVLNLQGFSPGGVYALSLARQETCPLVVTSRGETLDRGPRGIDRQPALVKPFAEVLLRAAAVTAVSRPVSEDLRLRFGAGRVRLIPDGLDAGDLSFGWSDIPWQIDGRRVVFAAGPIDSSSGFDLLVESASRSTVPHRLVIGGEGAALPGLRAWSERIGGAASIEWAGPLSARQIAAGMDHADVVVFPDRAGTDVSDILSAWKLGTPVVASATAEAVSVIHHGMDGLLAPMGQSASLAECVGRLLIDHRLAESLAEEGRRRVAGFSWETTARRYLEVFRSL